MQTEILIDHLALKANVQALRAHIGNAAFLAVVKANAYGHGLSLVAPALRDAVDAFGVYTVAEASLLRELGIEHPIHLLGPVPPHDLSEAISADIIFPLWDEGAWQRDLAFAAHRCGRVARVQLKIDTGLSRLGSAPFQAQRLREKVQENSALQLVGAYSHLAAAEELDSRYTLEQLAIFQQTIPKGSVPLRHIAASAAAMLWPQTRLDLVRIGIALYGIWPSSGTRQRLDKILPLQAVLSWRTTIVVVRDVAAETAVGYGCTYRPATATRLGILPIGYAEGLPRSLSNTGHVLVDGQSCPIVGRICMNMSYIDLAAAPFAHVGSIVTIIGHDGATANTVEDLALAANTIGYEIVARLPSEIPRCYLEKRKLP